MPAASAAWTPAGASSTTTQSRGSNPMVAAACRNRSGAGLPCATSLALKICASVKRPSSPLTRSANRIRSCVPLDATHVGSEMASSAASIPRTGRELALEQLVELGVVALGEVLGHGAAEPLLDQLHARRPAAAHERVDRLLAGHGHPEVGDVPGQQPVGERL